MEILVRTTRNDLDEILHRGAFSIVGPDSQELFAVGDSQNYVYPRSALKFFQVLPLLESGAADHFGFSEEEIALMCASHNSEGRHLKVARSILHKAGIPETALGCGFHKPIGEEAYEAMIRSGDSPSDVYNNCSGKHGGFLALAKYLDSDLDAYLHTDHPVQVLIREVVCDLFEMKPEQLHAGVDGCSAPNYAIPLHALARGFKNLSLRRGEDSPRGRALDRMIRAITAHPYMIGGSKRYCSDLMRVAGDRVIGKLGAAGVYGMSLLRENIGIAIKIEDGATGPQYNVAQEILIRLGILDQQQQRTLHSFHLSPVLNCQNKQVGESRVEATPFTPLHL